jgi:NTP pyrophosphatase (non-canonical NTP hydrolase)
MRSDILNEKQKEVLHITQEECAEVTQAISKIFRFGFDMRYPVDGDSNREKLMEEVGDLVAMIRLMIDFDIIDMDAIEKAADNKMEKLKRWSNLYDE